MMQELVLGSHITLNSWVIEGLEAYEGIKLAAAVKQENSSHKQKQAVHCHEHNLT